MEKIETEKSKDCQLSGEGREEQNQIWIGPDFANVI